VDPHRRGRHWQLRRRACTLAARPRQAGHRPGPARSCRPATPGKADDLDAHAAARAVQAGTATGQPKAGDGTVAMLRSLRLARRSAVKARTQAATSSRRCW
jgi:hypothetical protein